MKRSLFGIAAIAAMIGTPALAADMMPLKAPPVTPVWGWTGFYIGGDAGAACATDTVSPLVADGGTFPRSNKLSTSGILGGATAGFNYQFNSLLIGIEGDLGAMEIGGSKADPLGATEIDNLNNGLYGDVTGRVGFVWGSALLYGKGGWAYYNGQASTTTGLAGYSVTQSGNFTGWTYGGGLEYRLGGPWSAKIEYLHFAFGTRDASITAVTAAPVGTVYPYANGLSADTVKFGLNYQFGGFR
jgi:outer membrane immunogenic protein